MSEREIENPNEIILYRGLRSNRNIGGGVMHDECEDIIKRNPDINFQPGLTGIDVDHMIYKGTVWESSLDDKESTLYLERYQGRMGYIIVSIRADIDLICSKDKLVNPEWLNSPRFFRPEYFRADQGRNWFEAGITTLARVRIERVIEIS